jgi:hypothetical protein
VYDAKDRKQNECYQTCPVATQRESCRDKGSIEFIHLVIGVHTSTVAVGEVAALQHELRNHAVKLGALEVQRLARLAHALLASLRTESHTDMKQQLQMIQGCK